MTYSPLTHSSSLLYVFTPQKAALSCGLATLAKKIRAELALNALIISAFLRAVAGDAYQPGVFGVASKLFA